MSSEQITALTMPKWGLSMKEGKLINWLVSEGSEFSRGDELAEVETEKIASAVEASFNGTLRKIVAETDVVYPVGALLGVAADAAVSDADIEAFVEKFQAEFVPEEDDDGEAADTYETIEVNGLNLRYSTKGEGDECILLIHGFGGDLDNWLFNQDALAAAGKQVIAVDLPGHGQSSKRVGDSGLAFMAETIDAFLDALGKAEAHLIGHSMGAAIALKLAKLNPSRVQSLGLVCPAALSEAISSDYLNGFVQGATRKQMKPVLQQLFADESLVTRQMINNILQYKRLDGVDQCLQTILSTLADGDRQRELLNEVLASVARVCVIRGRKDRVIPYDDGLSLPQGVTDIVLEDVGHMAQMEAASEVNESLKALVS